MCKYFEIGLEWIGLNHSDITTAAEYSHTDNNEAAIAASETPAALLGKKGKRDDAQGVIDIMSAGKNWARELAVGGVLFCKYMTSDASFPDKINHNIVS